MKIPGPFRVSIVGQSSSKMSHNCVPCFFKAQLGRCFVLCDLAHDDAVSSELLDMINAPQAYEYHVAAELWLQLAIFLKGFYGILRVNKADHDVPFQQSGQFFQLKTLLFIATTYGFGSPGHFGTLLLVKPCRRNKSMCSH